MSTKGTIKYSKNWHLFEELLDNTVWITIRGGHYVITNYELSTELPPALIDAIRSAPASAFPHLREKKERDAGG